MNFIRDTLLTVMILAIITASWLIIPLLAILLIFIVSGGLIYLFVSSWFEDEPEDIGSN